MLPLPLLRIMLATRKFGHLPRHSHFLLNAFQVSRGCGSERCSAGKRFPGGCALFNPTFYWVVVIGWGVNVTAAVARWFNLPWVAVEHGRWPVVVGKCSLKSGVSAQHMAQFR